MFTDLTLFEPKLKLFPKHLKVEIKSVKDLNKLNKENFNIIQGSFNNRRIVENKNTDILLSPENPQKEDSFHFRNSGLNHILCNLMKKNNIYYGINFSCLLHLNSFERIKIIGRIMQNIKLCRKYKIPMILATFASEIYELRSPKDLISLALSIGMSPLEAKNSLLNINKLLKEKQEKDIEIIE